MNNKINVGGQAVIEGVMMRSPNFYSVAVLKKNKKISIKTESVNSLGKKYKFLRLPLLRGFLTLIETMIIGFKTLDFSARLYETENQKKNKKKKGKTFLTEKQKENLESFFTYLLSFAIVFVVFIYLPIFTTKLMAKKILILGESKFLFNIIVILKRLFIFFIYVWAISFMEDVKRLFMYHGAEHKVIYAYEKGKALTIRNAEKFTTLHPRCGTAFIFITFIISILFFAIFLPPHLSILKRLAIEIPLIIPIAGISYEILKLSDKFSNNILFKIFIFPGLLFQKITTANPDKEQLKVAITALKEVLKNEKKFGGKEKDAGKVAKISKRI